MFRDFLTAICQGLYPAASIYGCECGSAAVQSGTTVKPDLILLDINLPDMDGFEVGQQLLERYPFVRVLVVSAECTEALVLRLKNARFAGFVDKKEPTSAISTAIATVLDGQTYLSESVRQTQTQLRTNKWPKVLTNTEIKVLPFLGAQVETPLIAAQFGIAKETILWHKKNIKLKLDLKSDIELTRFCAEKGFVLTGSEGFRPVSRF